MFQWEAACYLPPEAELDVVNGQVVTVEPYVIAVIRDIRLYGETW
jgi:hypothetical protein